MIETINGIDILFLLIGLAMGYWIKAGDG